MFAAATFMQANFPQVNVFRANTKLTYAPVLFLLLTDISLLQLEVVNKIMIFVKFTLPYLGDDKFTSCHGNIKCPS